MAKLGDVCEILDSKRVPITASERKEGPYPYYGANGVQGHVDGYIFDDELVLLAEDGGNFGSKEKPIAYRVSGKCWVNNHAHVLKPKQGLDVDYLCYSLMFYDVTGLVNGATRQKLTQTDMRKMEILLRPLDEQRRIASILDKVTDLITKRRTQLEKLDLLVKSRFVEMFGTERDFSKWNIAKVEDVAEVCVGVVIKPSQYYAEVGIKAFRSLNIGVMNVKNSDWVYFSEEGHLKNAKSTVHEGDILVVRSGAPGTACVVTKEYDGCNAVDIIIARPNSKKINSVFLAAFTNYPHGMNQIQKGTGGAAQQHFNVGQYKTMQIILPPLDLQNEFALYFHQTETTKSNIQKSLETLETLKKALMQEYFG